MQFWVHIFTLIKKKRKKKLKFGEADWLNSSIKVYIYKKYIY